MPARFLVRPNSSEDRNIEKLFDIPGIENKYYEPGILEKFKIPGIENKILEIFKISEIPGS